MSGTLEVINESSSKDHSLSEVRLGLAAFGVAALGND